MRIPYLGLAFVIFFDAGALFACGSDNKQRDAGPEADAQADADVSTDNPTGSTSVMGMDAGFDAGPCVALGCDELGYECGETVDNCGNPLNCNLQNNVSPCQAPERCGGDIDKGSNKCGCKVRPDACAQEGAQCGTVDECGTLVDCGSCPGGQLCLSGNLCQCTPTPNPCGGRVCGTVSDGCGATVSCGASAGQCAIGTCDAQGQCTCPTREVACAGQSGPVTMNGCTFDCSSACVPNNAAACAGADCGTAVNNCGETVPCGAAGGACAAGTTCVGPQHVSPENSLPPWTAAYRGGFCVADNIARMAGKYAVRSHAFQLAGNETQTILSRIESVMFATIRYARATGRPQITEQVCVATTVSTPADLLRATARFPNARRAAPVTTDLTLNGSTWSRGDIGSVIGWTPGIPTICQGREGQEVQLDPSDPRYGSPDWWSDNRCVCPTAANQNTIPQNSGASPDNYEPMPLRDCRIVDGDMDGKPGVTATGTVSLLSAEVYTINITHGTITGVVHEGDRFHTGHAGEAIRPPPATAVVVACEGSRGICAAPYVNCGCPEHLQPVQFVPLADDDPLDCGTFLSNVGSEDERENQGDIDRRFAVSFGTCTAANQCPAGTLCRGGSCFPVTSPAACTYNGQNPAPASGFTEGCPSGMECLSDTACWPTDSACPEPLASMPRRLGELCAP